MIGEWTPTISCANYTTTSCGGYLGNTYGTPVIRRLHNGSWAVLFGNGLNSQNGTAGMYIMLVDSTSGNVTFRYLDTGYGPSQDPTGNSNKNGIAWRPRRLGRRPHCRLRLRGRRLWEHLAFLILTSQDPALWSVSSGALFSTSAGQPITSKVVVASIPGVGSVPPTRVCWSASAPARPSRRPSPARPPMPSTEAGPLWCLGLGHAGLERDGSRGPRDTHRSLGRKT